MLTTHIAATDAGQERAVSFVLTQVGNDQPATADIIKRGQEALTRLERNSWPDWVDVIRALDAGRTYVLQEANSNTTKGHSFHKCMGRWLRVHHFDRIDKGDRSRLLECADNLDAINAWRSNLPPEIQFGLNHFRVVLTRWKHSRRPRTNNSKNTVKPSLLTAWEAAGKEQRKAFLDSLGREGLCAAMSAKLVNDLTEHVVGLQIASASAPQPLITQLVRIMISTTSEAERANAADKVQRKLKKNGRTVDDLVASFTKAMTRRRR